MKITTMKRTKKIIKKPEPADESANGSDSDEVPMSSTKKVKVKGKKAIPAKPEDSGGGTTEIPKKTSQNGKGKGKKAAKEPAAESPDNSDADDESKEKPKQNPRNTKRKMKKPIKLQEPAVDSTNNSAESVNGGTEKPKQTLKSAKGKNKKPVKLQEPMEDVSQASNLVAAPTQTKKKVKRKERNAKLSKPTEESPHSSDAEDLPPKITKPKVAKVLTKPGAADKITDPQVRSESKIKGKIDLYGVPKPGEVENNGESSDESSTDASYNPQHHMQRLESIDPSFYQFLQKHDAELLEFDAYEDGLDEKEGDADFEKVHVPGELHRDSDESDFEADDSKPIKGKVTLKMIKEFEMEFIKKEGRVKLSTIVHAVKLFNAAVRRVTSVDGNTEGEYKVAGSSVFNAVVNMCVLFLPWGIRKYLGMANSGVDPLKCKHFVKIKGILVQYLNDLVKLLEIVTSDHILIVMLKHLHQMARYVACFTRIAKKAIKRILPLWSSGEETVRVLAFVCILRITRNRNAVLYDVVLKAMFMTYVRNCKFVSPTTWPGINFMRRSLAEIFMLDLNASYPQVFLYIRQLGIHLRNAIMVPNKDHKLAVYNWQYINSLHLWAMLLQQTVDDPKMKSLYFPLSMIISNTIKLVTTPQYYPLRFHLTKILVDMSRESGLFIPILGFLVDVLMKFDFNGKHKKVSMKPLDFSCMIRANKSQMSENGFKDAVVDKLYALTLEYATTLSSTISFPDVMVILIVFLKEAVNKSNNPNHKRKFKQLLEKIEEGAEHMRKLRLSYKLSFRDQGSIRGWEAKVKAEGTPLMAYFDNWNKINNIQKRKAAVLPDNDEAASAMPPIKQRKIYDEAEVLFKDNTVHPMTLFPSDSEDEIDYFRDSDDNKVTPNEKNIKKAKQTKKDIKQKVIKQKDVKQKDEVESTDAADKGDIVKEFSASDW